MTIEIRPARTDEFPAIAELDGASFGVQYSEQELADARLDMDPEQAVVAVDGSKIVGVSAELPLRMGVPGGDVAAMGLTWVSVEVTHRRRGIQRSMVEQQLRRFAADGWAAAVLTASEGAIYRRYGFGIASHLRRTELDRRRARLAVTADTSAVQRLTTDEAREVLAGLHERWCALTPGAISRGENRWRLALLDREYQRHGMSGLFHLVHPDGYVSYRIKSEGESGNRCRLVDYVPVTARGHAALWQTLLGMDLVETIESDRIPLDDPLAHLLMDGRVVRTQSLRDDLWLRPLDIAALLSARSYAVEVETVITVTDRLLGDGRYLLRGCLDGATCERTERVAQVELDVATLGAACLGGSRLATAARAGLVTGEPAAIARLDVALLADRLPFLGSGI